MTIQPAAACTLLCVLAAGMTACAKTGNVAQGDTIVSGDVHYRLWGIEAPAFSEVCADGWPAGLEARRALQALIADRRVACEDRGSDPYRRRLGLCRVDGRDLGAEMVAAGLAWANSSPDYRVVEQRARGERLGIHAHDCPKPEH